MTIALTIGFFFLVLFFLPAVWTGVPIVVDAIRYCWMQRAWNRALEARRAESEDLAKRGVVYYRDEKYIARHIAAQRLMRKQRS